jgi:hypothetical protein
MTTKKAPAKKASAPKAEPKGITHSPEEGQAARDATMAEDVHHLRTVGQVETASKAERG